MWSTWRARALRSLVTWHRVTLLSKLGLVINSYLQRCFKCLTPSYCQTRQQHTITIRFNSTFSRCSSLVTCERLLANFAVNLLFLQKSEVTLITPPVSQWKTPGFAVFSVFHLFAYINTAILYSRVVLLKAC